MILSRSLISDIFKILTLLSGRQRLFLNPKIGASTSLFQDSISYLSLPPIIQTQTLQPS